MEHPCFNCKNHRYGIDVGDKLSTHAGIYCCWGPTGRVLILDKSAIAFIAEMGCRHREEREEENAG